MSNGSIEKSPFDDDDEDEEEEEEVVDLVVALIENLLRFSFSYGFRNGKEVNLDPSDLPGHVLCFIFSDEEDDDDFKRGK